MNFTPMPRHLMRIGDFDAAAAGMIESKDVKTCREVHQ